MSQKNLLKLIYEIEEYFDECKETVFNKGKVVVERDVLYEMIKQIRETVPEEIKKSQKILDEKDKILGQAKANVNSMSKEMEEKYQKMIDENSITKEAKIQAAQIIEAAEVTAKEMRLGSYEYAEELLESIRNLAKSVHEQIVKENAYFEANLEKTMDTIDSNVNELKFRKQSFKPVKKVD